MTGDEHSRMVMGVTVGRVSQVGAGLGLPAAVAVTLVGAASVVAVQAVRGERRPAVAGGCLLGTGAVCLQFVLLAGNPTSGGAVLAGVLGASCWYAVAARLLSERPTGAARQWLAVGSAVWVAGTVTVTNSAAPGDWPLVWSLLAGSAVLVAAVLARRSDASAAVPWRPLSGLGCVLVVPAVLGLLAGEAVLFVAYVVAAATAVVCWSLVRLALGG